MRPYWASPGWWRGPTPPPMARRCWTSPVVSGASRTAIITFATAPTTKTDARSATPTAPRSWPRCVPWPASWPSKALTGRAAHTKPRPQPSIGSALRIATRPFAGSCRRAAPSKAATDSAPCCRYTRAEYASKRPLTPSATPSQPLPAPSWPNSLPFRLLLASFPVAESRMTQPCGQRRDAVGWG